MLSEQSIEYEKNLKEASEEFLVALAYAEMTDHEIEPKVRQLVIDNIDNVGCCIHAACMRRSLYSWGYESILSHGLKVLLSNKLLKLSHQEQYQLFVQNLDEDAFRIFIDSCGF